MTTNVISLGLGVQSTALYYMSSMGELPRADFAVFADPGKEKKSTIAYLKYLKNWSRENNGIPIIINRKKNLYRDLLKSENSTGQRFSSIPSFTLNKDGSTGMLRRQCTGEYKIEAVNTAIRERLKTKSLKGYKIIVWKGITTDEIDRMSVPDADWRFHYYPFCGYTVSKQGATKDENPALRSRVDLMLWYQKNGLPVPSKSSCVFCPYQSDAAWYDLKINNPSDFRAAVKVDRAIRDSSQKGITQKAFLHRSCVPLEEIEFRPGLPDLWAGDCLDNCHI